MIGRLNFVQRRIYKLSFEFSFETQDKEIFTCLHYANVKYNQLRNILFQFFFVLKYSSFVNSCSCYSLKNDFPFYFRMGDTYEYSDIQNKKIPSSKNIFFRDQQIPSFHRSTYVLSHRRFSTFIKFLPIRAFGVKVTIRFTAAIPFNHRYRTSFYSIL